MTLNERDYIREWRREQDISHDVSGNPPAVGPHADTPLPMPPLFGMPAFPARPAWPWMAQRIVAMFTILPPDESRGTAEQWQMSAPDPALLERIAMDYGGDWAGALSVMRACVSRGQYPNDVLPNINLYRVRYVRWLIDHGALSEW